MNAEAATLPGRFLRSGPASVPITFSLRMVHALISAPTTIFLIALTAMLFRPPDLKSLPVDRIAFFLLLWIVGVRLCIARERPRAYPATWPMLALLFLGIWGVISQPYAPEAWSLLAAKWIVPVALFHIAGVVFNNEAALRKLEVFSIAVLAYLAAISVFTLFDLKGLILPRFILDESLGIHADRARGPFLQAVANGVCLNMLALVALHSHARRRLPRFLAMILFLAVPLALLATRTRAVWLSAALSVAVLVMRSDVRIRRVALALSIVAGLGFCATLIYQANSEDLSERLEDRSPLEFRMQMYQSGLEMLSERPLLGWGSDANVQPEIAKRINDFHPEHYLFHNTYLELAVERGALGLGLYAWLMVCFFRLGSYRKVSASGDSGFLGEPFRWLWPLMLGAYLLNASAVVMNYQFVNGYLFTVAGILSAQAVTQSRPVNKLAIAGVRR